VFGSCYIHSTIFRCNAELKFPSHGLRAFSLLLLVVIRHEGPEGPIEEVEHKEHEREQVEEHCVQICHLLKE
jgi:hypothetical protein